MSTPEKPRPSLDDTIARIDEALEDVGRPATAAEVREHILKMYGLLDTYEFVEVPTRAERGPDADGAFVDELAAVYPTRPRGVIDVPAERTYVAFDEPHRGSWLARALHRLFGDGAS